MIRLPSRSIPRTSGGPAFRSPNRSYAFLIASGSYNSCVVCLRKLLNALFENQQKQIACLAIQCSSRRSGSEDLRGALKGTGFSFTRSHSALKKRQSPLLRATSTADQNAAAIGERFKSR